MKGRLENTIKVEKNVDCLLSELPKYVTEYYYNLSSKREPKTCLEYIRKIKKFLLFVNNDINSIDIKNIDDVVLAKYMKKLETTEKNGEIVETSFSYRKQNHTILNSFFEFLFRKHYINSNPMDLIGRETGKDHPNRLFLKEKDLKRILKSVKRGAGTDRMIKRQNDWRERDVAVLMLFMQTGMRETALSEINISDIDFDNNILVIVDKGHEQHKYVLSEQMIDAINEWLYHREDLLRGYNDNDALFISSNRTRITSTSISKIVRKYAKDALGYEISPHKLRAAYCNILLNKTGNLYLVSRLVGHKRPDTTEIYLDDTSMDDKAMAAQLISKSIF